MIKGAGESARRRWRGLRLGPAQIEFQEGVPITARTFSSWRVVACCLSYLLCCFLSGTYIPSVSKCLGPGTNSVPFRSSFSFLPTCFLSIFPPLSVLGVLMFIWFISPSLSPPPPPFVFVKPSSFKIIKWWFFGWGNNTFKKNTYIRKPFFISGTLRNHYISGYESISKHPFGQFLYQMQKSLFWALFCLIRFSSLPLTFAK